MLVPQRSTLNSQPSTPTLHIVEISESVLEQLQKIEIAGVALAEQKQPDLTGALAKFTEAIELEPTYASAYNNRAQVYLLQDKLSEAVEDLGKAIEWGAGDAKVLKNAYTQRAIAYKRLGKDELALADFESGGKLGNAFAQENAVRLNPYAQMCNAMMEHAMKHLEFSDSSPAPDATVDTTSSAAETTSDSTTQQ
jgi:tetratricopeptide repeat protein 36